MNDKCMNCGQTIAAIDWKAAAGEMATRAMVLEKQNKDLLADFHALRGMYEASKGAPCSPPPAKPDPPLDMDFLADVGMDGWVESGIHPGCEYDFMPYTDLLEVSVRKSAMREQFTFTVRVTTVREFREFCRFLGVEVP